MHIGLYTGKEQLIIAAVSLTILFGARPALESIEMNTQADLLGQRNMLSAQGRTDLPPSWERQQKEITLAVGDARVVNKAYREGIVIVPGSGPATMVVDDSHGCLMVDPSKSNEENGKSALSLLQSFNFYKLGTYTVDGFSAGGKAADFCARPAPVVK